MLDLNEKNLAATVEKTGIVLIDFWASWCGPCRAFAPTFAEAEKRHTDVTFAKVDTEDQPAIAGSFSIRAIPTLIGFRDGIVVFAHSGVLPAAALDDVISQMKALDMNEVRQKIAEADTNDNPES